MGLLLILLGAIGLIVWAEIIHWVSRREGKDRYDRVDYENMWQQWVGWIIAPIVTLIILCVLIINVSTINRLVVYHDISNVNYISTVEKTASYLSEISNIPQGTLIEGSIEKLQLATSVSSRVAEWRDATTEYNKSLVALRYWNSNFFTAILVADPPERLKLLSID